MSKERFITGMETFLIANVLICWHSSVDGSIRLSVEKDNYRAKTEQRGTGKDLKN